MPGPYCRHRIVSVTENGNTYSVWCRKAKDHASDGHTYWASGMHVKWTDEGEVVETSGANVWAAGTTYPTREATDG